MGWWTVATSYDCAAVLVECVHRGLVRFTNCKSEIPVFTDVRSIVRSYVRPSHCPDAGANGDIAVGQCIPAQEIPHGEG